MEQARKWPDVACRTALHSTVQHCTAACALASWSWPTPIHPSIHPSIHPYTRIRDASPVKKQKKKEGREETNKQITKGLRHAASSHQFPFLLISFSFALLFYFAFFSECFGQLVSWTPRQATRQALADICGFFSHLLASDKPAAKITTVLPHLSGAVVPFCFFTSFCLKA